MTLHIVTLILLSLVTHSYIGVLMILILWSFAAWSTGPTQQFHLATIEPEMSGVLLSMNQSMMQFAMAVGAGIGEVFVENVSLASITWVGALGVMIAIITSLTIFHSQPKQTLKDINQ